MQTFNQRQLLLMLLLTTKCSAVAFICTSTLLRDPFRLFPAQYVVSLIVDCSMRPQCSQVYKGITTLTPK